MLYEVFILASLKLSPASHQVWLWIGHSTSRFQFTYIYICLLINLWNPSICYFQLDSIGLLLEEKWLWLWLCESELDIDRGSNWRNECLCVSCVTVLHIFTYALAGIDKALFTISIFLQVRFCSWFTVEGQ